VLTIFAVTSSVAVKALLISVEVLNEFEFWGINLLQFVHYNDIRVKIDRENTLYLSAFSENSFSLQKQLAAGHC